MNSGVLVTALQPSNYSVRATGVNNTTGVILVEVYELPSPPPRGVPP